MIEPISYEQYHKLVKHLVYYSGRWEYFREVHRMVMSRNPQTLLEIGAIDPIFVGSDVMDLPDTQPQIRYRHDARVVPWPIADKAYDCVVALQVWEHLGPMQQQAFSEVIRVSHSAILSFPLGWLDCPPSDIHYDVTEEDISSWTIHTTPSERLIVERPLNNGTRAKHLILAFDALDMEQL